MWQRNFLLVSGIIELLLLTPTVLLIGILGYHGFATGEMGNMIGILSAVSTAVAASSGLAIWASVGCLRHVTTDNKSLDSEP